MGCVTSSEAESHTRAGNVSSVVKHCPYGHRLYKRNRAIFTCDACKNIYFAGDPCYACICGVETCEKCYSMNVTCKGNHVLYESRMRQPFKCDVCGQEHRKYGTIALSCRQCNFDCCKRHENDPAPAPAPTQQQQTTGQDQQHDQQPQKPAAEPEPQFKPPVPAQHTPASGSNFRSLFIGINYFGTSAELAGCVRDIAVSRDMVKKLGFDITSNSRVLVDDKSFPGRTGNPDKASILESLKWLIDGADASSNVFLHYSGHGAPQRDTNKDEEDGQDEVLVPADYEENGVIVDDETFEIVKKLPKGARMTIICDCCHSGSVFDQKFIWKWQGEEKKFTVPPRSRDFAFASSKKMDADLIAFSGCMDSQTSADVSNVADFKLYLGKDSPGKAGGALTSGFASAVQQKFDEASGTLRCSYMELFYIIQQDLKKRKFTQIPQMSASKKFDMNSDFTLFGPLPQA